MKRMNSFRKALLTGALVLLAIPGCQGEEPAAEPPPSVERAQSLTCEAGLVPTMTSATAPAGTVTRSGVYDSSYEAWRAFDASTNSMWISAVKQTPAWIAYEFADGPKLLTRYALTYTNGDITTRAPKEWTFEGWNGSAWVVLDTRTNQTGWTNARREYTLATPANYAKFRLNVSDDNDTRTGVEVISLGRMELIGCAGVTEPLWTRMRGATGFVTRARELAADASGRTYSAGYTGQRWATRTAFLDVYDTSGNSLWSVQMGGTQSDTQGEGVAASRVSAHVFMAGLTGEPLDGVAMVGNSDAFLKKYSSNGVRQWTRLLGAPGDVTRGFGVGVDAADNAFIVGSTTGHMDGNTRVGSTDAFVTKYDASGNKLWTRTQGAVGETAEAKRAAADGAGNVYVGGETWGGLDGNTQAGNVDLFITKYSAAGVKQWTRQLGAANAYTTVSGVALDAAGSVYVTGYCSRGLDGNPGGTDPQMYLAKYDASGVKQWVRQLGYPHSSWGGGIVINASGIYVGGSGVGDLTDPSTSNGGVHSFIAKYDASGGLTYLLQQAPSKLAGADAYSSANGLGLDASGNAYLAGETEGSLGGVAAQGLSDGYVMKLRLP
ncbi:SBBP repeat-containing protein [Myxococcaceae bacterium GXIMD 01537]